MSFQDVFYRIVSRNNILINKGRRTGNMQKNLTGSTENENVV